MVDLSTDWMGLRLRSPLVAGAGPLSQDPDGARRAVAAGAGAIVMHSLFEEQLAEEQMAVHLLIDTRLDHDAEAAGFLPDAAFALDGEAYLAELAALKAAVDVPVLASLNGTTPGGWARYATKLAQAGADGLELNLYDIATDPAETAAEVEARQLALVRQVAGAIAIPVGVKLAPTYAALPNFARALHEAGARGVTVFNRLHDPHVDLDTLEVRRTLALSTPAELPQRLHALALLSAACPGLALACSGGVHAWPHAARALACGATVVQTTSAVLAHGPELFATLRQGLTAWLAERGYASAAELRGILNHAHAPDPEAWSRLNYVHTLDGWRSLLNRTSPG